MNLNDITYSAIADNLRECPVRLEHDPYCFCTNPDVCLKRVKLRIPTPHALFPLRALEEVKKEDFKKKLKYALKIPTEKKEPEEYCFITINPHQDITLPQFLKKIKKTLACNLFSDHLAVLEQRGDSSSNIGTGLHSHILFKRRTPLSEGQPPTYIKRYFRNSYKNFCDVKNTHILNFQFISKTDALTKFNYIINQKSSDHKKLKQNFDKIWRKNFNIPEYLGNLEILN